MDGTRQRHHRTSNTPKHGYSLFLFEFKGKYNKRNNVNKSMPEVAAFAYPQWKALTEEERSVYEQRARDMQAAERAKRMERKVLEEAEQTRLIEETVEVEIKRHIGAKTLFAPFADFGFSFCVASVAVYLRQQDGTVVPAEFALRRATVSDGALAGCVVHRILKCGEIHTGLRGEAEELSRSTHGIPLNFPGSEDYEDLMQDVEEIMDIDAEDYGVLPVFAHPDVLADVRAFFRWLWSRPPRRTSPVPKVCSLVKLARWFLADRPDMDAGSLFAMKDEDYKPGMACTWHEHERPGQLDFCARYRVHRQVALLHHVCGGEAGECNGL